MNKHAFNQGFIKKCAEWGVTNPQAVQQIMQIAVQLQKQAEEQLPPELIQGILNGSITEQILIQNGMDPQQAQQIIAQVKSGAIR